MIKTLMSFFRFYHHVLRKSPKQYEIAMDKNECLATLLTPIIMLIIYMVLSVICLPVSALTFMFLWIPVIAGNLIFIGHVRNQGYEIRREEDSIRREYERREYVRMETDRIMRKMREQQKQREEMNRREKEREDRFYRQYQESHRHRQQQQRHQQYQQRQETTFDKNMANAINLLGLNSNFTEKDVKSAYKRLAKVHHPDVGGLPDNFVKLNKAYNYIIDRI